MDERKHITINGMQKFIEKELENIVISFLCKFRDNINVSINVNALVLVLNVARV